MKYALLLVGFFFGFSNAIPRLSGGDPAAISQFPFTAALLTNSGSGSTYLQHCGGTLVTQSAILSAASCFHYGESTDPPSAWRARLGSNYSDRGGIIYLIRTITTHEDYNSATRENNIAVLRTTFNVRLEPGLVEVARIAGAAFTFVESDEVTAIGWAERDGDVNAELHSVNIWPVNQAVCSSRYSGIGVPIPDTAVCVGWIDVGVRGQCDGDTGSPLVNEDNIVVGLFSWANGCADVYYPGINTRVSSYVNWIITQALA